MSHIPNSYPKRLIEVDLPIRRISAHARREKSIRHGHISTLHIWWARRPLAACRAVICAALWPDPADPLCPQAFRDEAARHINAFAKQADGDMKLLATSSEESKARWAKLAKAPVDSSNSAALPVVRAALLDFIADFANWDNSTVKEYLETSRALTQAAHEALGGAPGTRPLVVDPFAGGGAIPLESLRVGADAFASDLNPVAVLLNKVVLEYIPKYGQRLADELRKWGGWIKKEAEKDLADFYPKGPDGATPIAYLWARTVKCQGPGCGAVVPLFRSPWLAKKGKRAITLRLLADAKNKGISFEVIESPRHEHISTGTVRRGSATCPVCGYTTGVADVRKQMQSRRGGADDARLMAVVAVRSSQQGRVYRLPSKADLAAAAAAEAEIESVRKAVDSVSGLSIVPNELIPFMSGVFNVPLYGHNAWNTLFSPRQTLALVGIFRKIQEAIQRLSLDNPAEFATAVGVMLGLAFDRQVDFTSALCSWWAGGEKIQHTFGRQALPMIWDFAECNPFSDSTGCWQGAFEWGAKVCEHGAESLERPGQAVIASATTHPLPDDSAQCLVTDPPYYNAVPYADLSDFFFVWLRRLLGARIPDFDAPESPKTEECCEMAGWDSKRYPEKDGKWFERKMAGAMREARRVLAPDGIATVVFAHKATSGWEALLQAMVDAGWTLTGSWPIDTEMATRLRAMNSAVLASSVHLVCRPRENPDGSVRADEVGDWREVLAELPRRIHEWMPRLAEEGVVGADAIFACLGPALEIYSRYSRVEKASGEVITLREYLEQVWAAVSTEALSMIFREADAAGLEPDARLTAMWLWTLGGGGNGGDSAADDEAASDEGDDEESSGGGKAGAGGFTLEYDAARKIAQGLGVHLEEIGSVVEVKGDKARLRTVAERTRHLFGRDEAAPTATRRKKKSPQKTLFAELDETEAAEGGWSEMKGPPLGETVLDRVHQAMILFAAGRTEAIKRFLVEDGAGQDARFWKLAQSLSALYPKDTDEKRWVDGVLARKKGMGF
ncbi:MAG: DUF1156 domain-containing protein [Candidatus Anammoximicrobium sp.]|nr:DUF1156 domain-containing protein [Candidatus Anammoximicrobium sp.]